MPKKTYIELWVQVLKESDIERPFTTKQAYAVICNEPARKRGAVLRRKKVPAGTNELGQRLKRSKEIKRVNKKCLTRKNIALWDFVDDK